MEKRSNLVEYFYLIILDIKDFNQNIYILIKRIRIIDIYNQVIGRKYTYLRAYIEKKYYRRYQLRQNYYRKNNIY